MLCTVYILWFGCLVAGSAADLGRRQIPNWVPGLITILALTSIALNGTNTSVVSSFVVAGGVLVVGFTAFVCGVVGAGDVKLLTACSLFVGPAETGTLVIYALIFGGLLGVVYIFVELFRRLGWYGDRKVYLEGSILRQSVPYGIAISLAAGALSWSHLLSECEGYVS